MEQNKISGNVIFFDDDRWNYLLPLTYTRPTSEIRIGLLTICEKWMFSLQGTSSHITQAYLAGKFPKKVEEDNLLINGGILPSKNILERIAGLQNNEALYDRDTLIAARVDRKGADHFSLEYISKYCTVIQYQNPNEPLVKIKRPWEILSLLSGEIIEDILRVTTNRVSYPISKTNQVIGNFPVFAEEGTVAECVIFNTTKGPIYLGKGSEVMEGSMIRGPFVLGENSTVNMGAKIYGPTAIGPKCKVGGEIKGTQFFGNANKGHDGFLGDSIIGEWCNLGADTNTSNLKNNYLNVRVWSFPEEKFVDTGLQFCGLILGDHSKSGINTMFNTGTVVGVYSNIFGEGYPRTLIPSFAWGGASGFQTHSIQKALETAAIVMSRREIELTEEDKKIAKALFEMSAKHRAWEK